MSMTKEEAETVTLYVRRLGGTLISGEQKVQKVLRDTVQNLLEEHCTKENILLLLDTVANTRASILANELAYLERHCAELEYQFAEQVH